jgi:hypothetical protein
MSLVAYLQGFTYILNPFAFILHLFNILTPTDLPFIFPLSSFFILFILSPFLIYFPSPPMTDISSTGGRGVLHDVNRDP